MSGSASALDAQGLALAARAEARRRDLIDRIGAGLQRGRLTPVMPTGAPTVTERGDTSGIAGGVGYSAVTSADRFAFLRAAWVTGDSFPINLGRFANAVMGANGGGGANGGSAPLLRFYSDAAEIEINNRLTSSGYRLKVDGEYVSADLHGHQQSTSFLVVTAFTWASDRRIRLYEVEYASGGWFGGVTVPPTSTVWPAPLSADEVRVVVHGDSFVEAPGLPRYLAQLLGQVDTRGTGLGATGFINPGPAGRVKFIDRVQTDVIDPAPHLIVEMGGGNDRDAVGTDAGIMQTVVTAWLDAVQAALPETLIVMTGPMVPSAGLAGEAGSQAMKAGKQAACAGRRNVVFVDNLAEPWVTGSGRVGAPQNDGIADWVTGSDGTHPTDAGALYLARRVAGAVAGGLG